MSGLAARVEGLSPEKRELLEILRRERGASAPGGAGTMPSRKAAAEPFALVSPADRERLPPDAESAYPLTLVQLGMLHRMELTAEREVPAYHNVNSFHIQAPFEAETFQRAVDRVVERHPILRTSFHLSGFEEPLQVVHRSARLTVAVEDLRDLDGGEQTRRLDAFLDAENRRLLDLDRPPLMRLRVHRWTEERFSLTLTEPHALSDGWSTAANLREIFDLYLRLRRGEDPPPEPPPAVTFGEYVALEREAMVSAETVGFWRRKVAEEGTGTLYRTVPPASEGGEEERKPSVWFPEEVVEGLHRVSRRARVPLKSVLLAAHLQVIGLFAGRETVVTGLTTHGRPERADGDRVRGLFLNTVPFPCTLVDGSWMELVRRVFEAEGEVWPHRRLPLAEIQRLAGQRTLFETAFSFLHFHSLKGLLSSGAGERIQEGSSDRSVTDFPLMATFTLRSTERARLRLTLEHDPREFAAGQIAQIRACYERVLAVMAADPGASRAAVPLVPPAEELLLLERWSRRHTVEAGPPVHRLFRSRSAQCPDAMALSGRGEQVTYGELAVRSEAIARPLRRLAAGTEVLTAVFLERGPEVVPSILGVLASGGAYLPVDPLYPPERLAFMLDDADPQVVLTERSLVDRVPRRFSPRVLCVEDLHRADPEAVRPDPDLPDEGDGDRSLAYVIYTSGSTGRPKGVMVPHAAVARLFRATAEIFAPGPGDAWSLFHSHAFDFSVWEMWGALAHGGRLVMVSERESRSPELFRELLARERVTFLNQTPSAFGQLQDADTGAPVDLALRQVVFGGEALDPSVLRPWIERHGDRRPALVNMYGITETTVHVTRRPVSAEDAARSAVSSIGRPIPDLGLYVMGPGLQPLPIGVGGEIHVGGAGVSRGYLRRPGLTAERFVPDPFADQPGGRLYRTGDLARFQSDGDVEYLGRIDNQVQIRGFRVELGEIDAALADLPAIRRAVTVVRTGPAGDSRLVSYAVPESERLPAPAELRRSLERTLPAYMIPSTVVALEALPLTPNGKVDRRALPEPRWGAEPRGEVLPRSQSEELIVDVWKTVLGAEEIAPGDDFFELGGHSLLAVRVVSRVREAIGIELPVHALFDHPTAAGLAREIDDRLAGRSRSADPTEGPVSSPPPIRPLEDRSDLPLSFSQERLWFLDRLDPGSAVYNLPAAVRLRGRLVPRALARSLSAIVRRHEVLRTRFEEVEGAPRQRIAEPAPVALPVIDLRAVPPERRRGTARRLAAAEARRPFDLSRAPLLRAALIRLSTDDHLVLATLHHVAADGWSLGILQRELSELYTADVEGRDAGLAELPVQYGDFAYWQRRWLEDAVLGPEIEYWEGRLAGSTAHLDLPTDRSRVSTSRVSAAGCRVGLAPAVGRDLLALGRRRGATPFMVLAGLFQALLGRVTGQEDFNLGTPVAGRRSVEVEPLIGFFVNTLVLRCDLSGGPSFHRLLDRVRRTTLEAQAHQDVPFERLVEALAPERDLDRNPLFQVLFVFQEGGGEGLRLAGLEASTLGEGAPFGGFDLALSARRSGDRFSLDLGYRGDLFDPTTARRLLGHLVALGTAAVSVPDAPLADLPLLTPPERHQALAEWSGRGLSSAALPGPRTLSSLVRGQAERTPDAVALIHGGTAVTYARLLRRAEGLAARLRTAGAGPGRTVGIFVRRSPEMMVAILGTLESGAAYVPLDPDYPEERTELLAEAAELSALVTDATSARSLPLSGVPVVRVDGSAADGSGRPVAGGTPDPESLAYILFTSGSTGTPKGVAITHRSASAMVRWAGRAFSADELAGVLAATSICFDLSVFELFVPLSVGGAVILAGDALELPALSGRERVTLVNTVPSVAAEILRADGLPGSVRTVNLAGEPLPESTVEALESLGTVDRVANLYGPSEDTTYSTWASVTSGDGAPRIGRPVTGGRAYVLDPRGHPAPPGAIGELFLSGEGLARGYLAAPAATAGSFLPDPFGGSRGGRLYRTGDLVRRRADGSLSFVGRRDHQVKIRGFRIELGEIETALGRCAGVREAVVLAVGSGGHRHLAAFVTADEEEDVAPAELDRQLRRSLPGFMVPSAVRLLDALPLTPNGKIDRLELARRESSHEPRDERPQPPPRTVTEEILTAIWEQVLVVERPGVDRSFFELGGHSLLAMRVLTRIRRAFGVDLPLRALFERPTLRGLGTAVDRARRSPGARTPPLVPVPRADDPPVTFAQRRLWFLDRLEPGRASYNVPLAAELEGRLSIPALAGALATVVDRHEVLRTTFPSREGQPVQRIGPGPEVPLPVVDLSGLELPAADREARRRVSQDAVRPFDLAGGPPLRAFLVRLDPRRHVLSTVTHHIVTDEWSLRRFGEELGSLYRALLEGRSPALPDLPVQYADFAVWQQRRFETDVVDAQLEFWRGALGERPPVLELPSDRPRPERRSGRGGRWRLRLSSDLSTRLRRLSRERGTTLFMTLLGGFEVLLGRVSGQSDLTVGTPISGRHHEEVEGLIGLFLNTLVLRADLGGDPGFDGLLDRVREVVLAAHDHQELPFERLVEELDPARHLARPPLFQVMFLLLHDAAGDGFSLPGLEVRSATPSLPTAKFDLTLAVHAHREDLACSLEYDADLFDGSTVQRMAGHLETLLAAVALDPRRRLSELPLLGAAERHQALREWNDLPTSRASRPVHELVTGRAAAVPDRIAVRWDGGAWSYRALSERARSLAGQLREAGAGPGARVAVWASPGPELAVSLLAVLEAGAAYAPLDPEYPTERLELMLADMDAAVLLRPRGAVGVPSRPGVRHLEAPVAESTGGPAPEPVHCPRAGAEDPAYVVYTSGSTGRPKGVAVPHRTLWHLIDWQIRSSSDEVNTGATLRFASPSFDVSLQETLVTWAGGGTLVLPPAGARRDGERLARAMETHRIERLFLPYVALHHLAEVLGGAGPPVDLSALREVVTAGERLRVTPEIRRFFARLGRCGLRNQYGPSEAHVVTEHVLDRGGPDRWPALPPIGRPAGGARVHVVDRALRPVPVGGTGEIALGGQAVGLGYPGRPRLTSAAFVPDPLDGGWGERLYRTGDLARLGTDGTIHFLGRIDHQIKLRGYRIEPGEIEAVLGDRDEVREAVAAVVETSAGESRLVAYVVPQGDAGRNPSLLRAFLKEKMPAYMVPSAFVFLDELPMTPTGKVDRGALPAPADAGDGPDLSAGVLETPVEEIVAGFFGELLGVDTIGPDDDFFALGGHSLLATRLTARLRRGLGVDLPVRRVFEAPTVRELARRVDEELRGGAELAAPPLVPVERSGALPLSFAQERLWFLDRLEPGSPLYNVPSSFAITDELDLAALAGSLADLVRRHEALRTIFPAVEGVPVQKVSPPALVPLPVIDLSALSGGAAEEEAARVAREEARRPFDLERGPLLRATAMRSTPADHWVLLTVHHIVSDGWSMGIFRRDMEVLYRSRAAGRAADLDPLPVQYADFSLWQRRWLAGEVLERQLAYWRERLAGAPTLLPLPLDRPRPAMQRHRGAMRRFPGRRSSPRACGPWADAGARPSTWWCSPPSRPCWRGSPVKTTSRSAARWRGAPARRRKA